MELRSAKTLSRFRRRIRGIEYLDDPVLRTAYGFDATGRRSACSAVVFPAGVEELARITSAAAEMELPLVARGAGTGFSGGSVPLESPVVVSTEKMNRVLSFDPTNEAVRVESGLVNGKLQQFLEGEGYFYPPDPASFRVSTIGGNIAENAGGPRAYKYGVTRRYVRSLEWITADGDIYSSSLEGAAALLPGSEGTLGIIASAVLGVLPLPVSRITFLLQGGDDAEAISTASQLLRKGFGPSVLEFIDSKTIRCVAEYLGLEELIEGEAGLFFEVEGTESETAEQKGIIDDFCRGREMKLVTAVQETDRELLWELRRAISPSLARRGITKVNEDIALPLGSLPEAAGRIHRSAAGKGLDCYIFGHCGDGNLHVNIMTDRRRKREMELVEEFVEELFSYVIEAGGTLSGEHGIGITKRGYLEMVYTADELELQEGLKRAVDPKSSLNPGKYFHGITERAGR